MKLLYYLAYGSNLHPLRLAARVPSARFFGPTAISGYKLCFHKCHQEDQSGKCNMYLTGMDSDAVYGAVYTMHAGEKPLLDKCEGPGYRCDTIRLELAGNQLDCFVYIAEHSHIDDNLAPYCWYKNIVLLGAEYHRLPEYYLDGIRQVKAAQDPDAARHSKHYELIEQMKKVNLAKNSM
ncbi:MAG: gamma-glutamylcyclotransferase [Gammaproteobacteria bacterium]|nr:gamma-glutamylcyclotransferase [Gammaproteobacteria bacterium]